VVRPATFVGTHTTETMMSTADWAAPQPHPSGLTSELRGWGVAIHLSGLGLGLLSAATIGFLAPLVVWLVKRDDHGFLDHHGKEALNFQLTVLAALLTSILLAIPVVILGVLTLGIGLVAAAVVALAAFVAWVVFPIMGAVAASRGEGYRYPLTIRFVR
jgi:uncharacterized protein